MTSSVNSVSPARKSAKTLAWERRRDAFRASWRTFRTNPSGMLGLGILIAVSLLAVCAPLIADVSVLDPTRAEAAPNLAPSLTHPLGTDSLGRPIAALLIWGARTSLLVGLAATVMSMVIGTTIGVLAGHFHGWKSAVLMRVIDFFLVIPGLVLAIVLASIMGGSTLTIILAIGLTSWAGTARLIRAQTLTLESRGYVERSRALGAKNGHLIIKHILPGVLPLVMTSTSLSVGGAIIAEATLAFLGINDGTHSWGTMLQLAMGSGAAVAGYWWFIVAPGAAILIVVLAFTLVSRALEAVINPTLRGR